MVCQLPIDLQRSILFFQWTLNRTAEIRNRAAKAVTGLVLRRRVEAPFAVGRRGAGSTASPYPVTVLPRCWLRAAGSPSHLAGWLARELHSRGPSSYPSLARASLQVASSQTGPSVQLRLGSAESAPGGVPAVLLKCDCWTHSRKRSSLRMIVRVKPPHGAGAGKELVRRS